MRYLLALRLKRPARPCYVMRGSRAGSLFFAVLASCATAPVTPLTTADYVFAIRAKQCHDANPKDDMAFAQCLRLKGCP